MLGAGSNGPEVIQANLDHNQSIHEYIIAAQSFLTDSIVPFKALEAAILWKEEAAKLNSFTTEDQIIALLNTSYPHPELPFVREKLEQFKLKQQIAQAQTSQCTLEELESLRESALKLNMADCADALTRRI